MRRRAPACRRARSAGDCSAWIERRIEAGAVVFDRQVELSGVEAQEHRQAAGRACRMAFCSASRISSIRFVRFAADGDRSRRDFDLDVDAGVEADAMGELRHGGHEVVAVREPCRRFHTASRASSTAARTSARARSSRFAAQIREKRPARGTLPRAASRRRRSPGSACRASLERGGCALRGRRRTAGGCCGRAAGTRPSAGGGRQQPQSARNHRVW